MSNPETLIVTARDVIEEGSSDTDWKIAPTDHAEMFEKKAPSLAKNLRDSRTKGLADMYEDLNVKAVDARDAFKDTVGRADTAVFYTATFGALLLIVGSLHESLGIYGRFAVGGIGVFGFVSFGLATMWLSQVKGGNLSKKWISERAKAEAKRLAYFKTVMEGASEAALEQLYAFEYTRRFLLENQIDYFRDRGGQHATAANLSLKRSTQAVFVASTFTGIAGLLSVFLPQLATIAGLGVIASAYAALSVSRSAVNLDRTNADRYRAAEDQLKERMLDIDTYRMKTASGNKEAVQEFFEPIFIILEADHKAFLSDTEQREMAIGGMEQRLDAAKEILRKDSQGGTDNLDSV